MVLKNLQKGCSSYIFLVPPIVDENLFGPFPMGRGGPFNGGGLGACNVGALGPFGGGGLGGFGPFRGSDGGGFGPFGGGGFGGVGPFGDINLSFPIYDTLYNTMLCGSYRCHT